MVTPVPLHEDDLDLEMGLVIGFKRFEKSHTGEEAILVRLNHCGVPTPEVVFLRDSLRPPTPERCFYGGGQKRFNVSHISEEAIFVHFNHCSFPTPEVVFLRDPLRPPTPESCF
ncbi:hypothetical protein CDAR_378131 [Caerostris darwini]|uniref:Uncharacterized protein n=1 Tax=Caerostris darwini TaxID=1538125 RepID=A0AAV4UJ57_9ARAC|nr:hypothetical protein CDAR_378131 [Caerostris darwini]